VRRGWIAAVRVPKIKNMTSKIVDWSIIEKGVNFRNLEGCHKLALYIIITVYNC